MSAIVGMWADTMWRAGHSKQQQQRQRQAGRENVLHSRCLSLCMCHDSIGDNTSIQDN
jgi:hypothetical protein